VIIWLALLIPIVMAIILFVFFRHQTKLWEFLIPFGVSVALILFFKLSIKAVQVMDTESWGGWVTKAKYCQKWDEYIHKTCSEEYLCGINSDGMPVYCTRYYECNYVEDHPAYYEVIESNGSTISVDEATYKKLEKQFGNSKLVDLGRDYYSIDGDMYETVWNGSDSTLEPATTTHQYVNRVLATSDPRYKFPIVDLKVYGLFEYPKITNFYEQPSILGNGGPTMPEAEKRLNFWNAKLGKDKEVRMFILVFTDKPIQAGYDQERYWQRGNKNEFILAIGVDKSFNVQWCHVISWTEVASIKKEAVDFVSSQGKLDLVKIVDWLGPKAKEKFVRKHFSDFDRLAVEPPLWAVILTYVVTFFVNLGVSYWIVMNQFQDNKSSSQ